MLLCVADSSCGVSVCLVKPRRSIAWWRPLPRATATATLTSSSRPVSATKETAVHFLSELYLWSENVYMCVRGVSEWPHHTLSFRIFFFFTLWYPRYFSHHKHYVVPFCMCTFFSVTSDTCYILSFAIIMLNTSLHNPCVKDKTTFERFISMNRGINNGENLPDDLLSVRTCTVSK